MEEWKPVPGFENFYQVSNYGNIRRITKSGYRFKKPYIRHDGYSRLEACCNGKITKLYIHRLVALCFIEIPSQLKHIPINKLQINHKDKNPKNNHVSNLEWCTGEYNVKYSLNTPITQFTLDGLFIKNYPSLKDAQIALGRKSSLSESVSGIHATGSGYIWKYTLPEYREGFKLDKSEILSRKFIKDTPVTQFDMSGNFIQNLDKVPLKNTSGIIACCVGKYHTSSNFIWRFTIPIYRLGFNIFEHQQNGYLFPVKRINTLNEKDICSFLSILDAYKQTCGEFSTTNGWKEIYDCCTKMKPLAFGFKWEFII